MAATTKSRRSRRPAAVTTLETTAEIFARWHAAEVQLQTVPMGVQEGARLRTEIDALKQRYRDLILREMT